ncbi:MAG: DNA mismatch repair protein MutS [Rickettsiales bacterium]
MQNLTNSILDDFIANYMKFATPSIKQYIEFKLKHLDCLLFFRIGDFYELLFDDAIIAHKELNLFLTSKSKANHYKIPMCGMPHHAAENYIAKLIKADYKIAICDQVFEGVNSSQEDLEENIDSDDRLNSDNKLNSNNKIDSAKKNSIMQREITKIITKGTITIDNLIDSSITNYLVSIYHDKDLFYITCADVSIGEVSIFITDNLMNEIFALSPKEILILKDDLELIKKIKQTPTLVSTITDAIQIIKQNLAEYYVQNSYYYQEQIENEELEQKQLQSQLSLNQEEENYELIEYIQSQNRKYKKIEEAKILNQEQKNQQTEQEKNNIKNNNSKYYPSKNKININEILENCFNNIDIKKFSLDAIKISFGMCITYMNKVKNNSFLTLPKLFDRTSSFVLDYVSMQHLEIFENIKGEKHNSLFNFLNKTITKQGSRLMQKFLTHPLKDINAICKRQDYISLFQDELKNSLFLNNMQIYLNGIVDFDRLLVKFFHYEKILEKKDSNNIINDLNKKAIIQHLINLKLSMMFYTKIEEEILKIRQNYLRNHYNQALNNNLKVLNLDFTEIYQSGAVLKVIINFITQAIDEQNQNINEKTHPKLEFLKKEHLNHELEIKQLEEQYKNQTQISSLKIIYNNLFGYCIEVQAKYADKINDSIQKNSTFINKYNTGLVSRFKTKDLLDLEKKVLLNSIDIANLEQDILYKLITKIINYANLISNISKVIAHIDVFLTLANLAFKNKYCKPIFNDSQIINIKNSKHPILDDMLNFIGNDVQIRNNIAVITGPNMAGKSTYLRQIAISILLAQIGSFIPGDQAEIGAIDQIFTRIGSSDNITIGQSTFMKEMQEVEHILRYATSKSLIILDEVGRGTSTFDGIAIAFAIIEYIYFEIKARCLFATHYHELLELKKTVNSNIQIDFYSTDIEIKQNKIKYLYKIIPGLIKKSYGIYVASLAKLPNQIIQNANIYLKKIQ